MFYKIYYIHINNVSDLNKLLSKLHNIGYQESYLSEFSFCRGIQWSWFTVLVIEGLSIVGSTNEPSVLAK